MFALKMPKITAKHANIQVLHPPGHRAERGATGEAPTHRLPCPRRRLFLAHAQVRNSWGTGWGESGFIRLAYGADTCAITTIPTYVKTAAA